MNHMIKHHVVLPLGIFLVLAAVGVPVATALAVGMMAACISMVFMRGHGTHHEHGSPPGGRTSERPDG